MWLHHAEQYVLYTRLDPCDFGPPIDALSVLPWEDLAAASLPRKPEEGGDAASALLRLGVELWRRTRTLKISSLSLWECRFVNQNMSRETKTTKAQSGTVTINASCVNLHVGWSQPLDELVHDMTAWSSVWLSVKGDPAPRHPPSSRVCWMSYASADGVVE
jgi:hypothetical protein